MDTWPEASAFAIVNISVTPIVNARDVSFTSVMVSFVIAGRIQTGSYTNKDGQKVYTTEVVVEEQEFAESKASSDSYAASHPQQSAPSAPSMPNPVSASADGFMNIPDGVEDEGLPFN